MRVGAVLRLEDEVKRVVWRFSKPRLKPLPIPLNAEYNEVETLNPSGLVSIEQFLSKCILYSHHSNKKNLDLKSL